jgi:hypothetical protein
MPPPTRIPKTAKTALEWALHLVIAGALGDSREAPWYGAWNIVLKDILFESSCLLPLLTVTYPQFPLSKNIDTHDLIIVNDFIVCKIILQTIKSLTMMTVTMTNGIRMTMTMTTKGVTR